MNFTEPDFWPKLLLGILVIAVLRQILVWTGKYHEGFDKVALASLSLYLLSQVGYLTTGIFVSVFATAWILVRVMFLVPLDSRRYILWFGIPLLCLPLFYFKYRVFVAVDVIGLSPGEFKSIAIPAGISFYTFQKVAMLVDASRMTDWKPKFLDYLNFASFFPQVVAGPIERKSDLFPQMENFRFQGSAKHLESGLPWIAIGLFYKLCIADNLSPYIQPDKLDSAWPVLFSTFFFGLKIYFDFCGYSLIAMGLAACFGVRLTLNFRSPYLSRSIQDFWRNWHISLSGWFRDYIYFPLGGSRTSRWWINLLVVFLISGLWHGAGWGFLIWGALHGFFSVLAQLLKGRVRLPGFLCWLITMACVFAAWLPFYEGRLPVLAQKIGILSRPENWSVSFLSQYFHSFDGPTRLVLALVIGLCIGVFSMEKINQIRKCDDYEFSRHPLAIVFFIVSIVFLGTADVNEFIYFAF